MRLCALGLIMISLGLAAAGCSKPAPPLQATTRALQTPLDGLADPLRVEAVDAVCFPPAGWRAEPLKSSDNHRHQLWISPTGRTAYGVILFELPFPVGSDLVLWAFMREMRKSEGTAELLDKQKDPTLPGLRFIAEGGLYTVRTNLIVRRFHGWAIYAGTLTNEPVDESELKLAERSREHTQIGLPKD